MSKVFANHVFGLSRDVRNNVFFTDEQTILYPAGTQLVSYNIEQKSQHFMPVGDGEEMSALAVNQNSTMVAVALKGTPATGPAGDDGRASVAASNVHDLASRASVFREGTAASSVGTEATIVLYDLSNGRKRKVLVAGDQIREYISVAFSPNGTHVIAQSAGPEWNLYMWDWDKGRLRGVIKTSNNSNAAIHQMSVSPYDLHNVQVCVTGNNLFRTYKHSEGSWKLQHQHKSDKNLLSHAYLSETRILAGTEDAKLQVFEAGELVLEFTYVIPSSVAYNYLSTPAITEIKAFSGGVLAGTSTGFCIHFERTEDSSMLKKNREFQLEKEVAVSSIALSPGEDAAIVTLKNSQIYTLPWEYDPGRGDVIKSSHLFQSFHNGPITGMDTAIRKPLLVTCGVDRSVRIWNYVDNNVEVLKTFFDEPMSVAIHPSGLYLLVGFSDGLKLMNVLLEDLEYFWETPVRGCRECHFSNGGQYFAAVHGSTILVYNMWTLEVIAHFKGHQSKIRSISWSADDSRIMSCGLEGCVYEYNVRTFKRETELSAPNVTFNQAIYTHDNKLAFAIGSDGVLRELSDGHVFREFSTKLPLKHIAVTRNGKIALASTANHTLRALKYPFPQENPYEYTEYSYHTGPINRLCLSYDDQYAFTCGEDGCLWFFRLSEKEARAAKREKDYGYSDEILVTKSDLRTKFKTQSDLKRRVELLKDDSETQLRVKDLNYKTKLQDLEEKYMNEVEGLKRLNAGLQDDLKATSRRSLDHLKETRIAQKNEIEEAKSSFKFKIEDVMEKYQEMQANTKLLQDEWQIQMKDMKLEKDIKLKEIETFFQEKLAEKVAFYASLKSELTSAQNSHDMAMTEIAQDTDSELLHLSYGFEQKLKVERTALASIKEENDAMREKFNLLTRDVEEQKTEMVRRQAEERRLQAICRGLEKDISGLRREIQERDDTIQDKAKRISDLKKKNQELEKFKFVLDYKIVELRKQIEPRERDIIILSKQIKEMDDELQGYHKQHDVLSTVTEDIQMRLRATKNEFRGEAFKADKGKAALVAIQADVAGIRCSISNLMAMKRSLIAVHTKHSTSKSESDIHIPLLPIQPSRKSASADGSDKRSDSRAKSASESAAASAEQQEVLSNEAQRDHLEREVSTLQGRLHKQQNKRLKGNMKILSENSVLLSEINLLRKGICTSEERTAQLLALRMQARPLNPEEYALMKPHQYSLRDALAKKQPQSIRGALNLLKGNVANLVGFPQV